MPDPKRWSESTRLLIAAAIGLAILLVSGLLFAQALPPGSTLEPRTAFARSQAVIGKAVGDYTLQDGDGKPVRLASYRGKPLIVSFVYTGCFQVCPTTTRFLGEAVAEAERVLGPGTFNVITVGFNLPFDTPAAMREFGRKHGTGASGWRFLAGDTPTIDGLARDTGFSWIENTGGFDHLTQATIVDGSGRIVRQVYGESFELPMFVSPLKELVAGQSVPVHTLDELIERVRIICTIYDPREGRYRLDYALFIEIFAGLTILGATLWWLASEWKRQRPARGA